MRHDFLIVFIFTVILIFVGCSKIKEMFDFQNPTIVFWSPIDRSSGMGVDDVITVQFSEEMDRESCEESITLLEDGKDTEVEFSWNNKISTSIFFCLIFPKRRLANSHSTSAI